MVLYRESRFVEVYLYMLRCAFIWVTPILWQFDRQVHGYCDLSFVLDFFISVFLGYLVDVQNTNCLFKNLFKFYVNVMFIYFKILNNNYLLRLTFYIVVLSKNVVDWLHAKNV